MKNHWLDKKIEKEIDKAFETLSNDQEFKDTDFIFEDLSAEMNTGGRYKDYDRTAVKTLKPFDFGEDENDKATVKEILLKHKDEPHWIDEVLSDVGYTFAPDPFLSVISTVSGDVGTSSTNTDSNITITTSGVSTDIKLADLPGWKDGKIVDMDVWKGKCEKCGAYQWPMNDENTMMQGDPGCDCYKDSCNLDIWYPDQKFIQNETLQVYSECRSDITQFQTMYTPVLPGTMTGTVYPTPGNRSYGYVFFVSSEGKFEFTRFVTGDDGKPEFTKGVVTGDDGKSEFVKNTDEISLEKLANTDEFDKFTGWYDEIYTYETNLNCQTGILELHYHMGHCPEIVVSYEYNREGP